MQAGRQAAGLVGRRAGGRIIACTHHVGSFRRYMSVSEALQQLVLSLFSSAEWLNETTFRQFVDSCSVNNKGIT